jgi:hypothetical protein
MDNRKPHRSNNRNHLICCLLFAWCYCWSAALNAQQLQPIEGCDAITCIDSDTVGKALAIAFGFFALGYAAGQGVLWVRRIQEVA